MPMTNKTRNYKDNVFCMLYSDKQNLLSLYNAMNGTEYQDEEKLSVVTLDTAICVSMRNDAAFVIDSRLNLYEQQSTMNCNMPLRNLYYVTEELKKLVPASRLYGGRQIRIPVPRFVVFYNGKEKQPAETTLRLSDMYEACAEDPELELTVRQVNINQGYNDHILEKCESLEGYMIFVNKVRDKLAAGFGVEEAVTEAVDECIREDVLAEFFQEHKSEVVAMGIFEYDAELHDQVLREESWELGKAEGRAEGKATAVIELIEELGAVPDQLRRTIMAQKDLNILSRWCKLAAKAGTIEELEREIQCW